MPRYSLAAAVFATAAAGGSLFVFWKEVTAGMIWFWNQIAEVLGSKTGIYLTVYQQSNSGNGFHQKIFLVYLGIALAAAGFLCLKLRLFLLVFGWAFLLPVLMVLTELTPDTFLCMAFYAGILLELNYMRISKGEKQRSFGETLPFLAGIVFAAAVAFIGGVFLQNLVSRNDYQDSVLVANAKEEALSWLSGFRYKGQKANSLPDGRLKVTGSWTASSDTALEVTMENPASLYLRGFVGSVYDGSSWESISPEKAYKEKALFYWLHQDGFYGENQLYNARQLVEDEKLSSKTGIITIKNKAASSKYLYTPYEMAELPEGYTGENAQADSTLKTKGLFGQRSYSFSSSGNLVKDFTSLGAEVYQTLVAGEGGAYRDQESYYNAFVYEYDTKLPASLENLFRQELGDGGNREDGHTDYYTAISRIRSYLEKNMTYSTAIDPYTGSGDFVQNFLTESKIGHSVHFASAAALMFRYYGIPARYAEGYLITPQDIEGKKSGDTISIPGKNGHAWTEIYIDGLGWIPLEMTPSYYDVMEEADLKTGLEAKGKMAVSIPESQEEPTAQENIRTNWSLKLALFGIEKFVLLFLIVFDTFCLLFMVTVFLLRALANRKRKKRFSAGDNREAVRAMAGYAQLLFEHGAEDYSKETRKLYDEICEIGQKAAFSPHPVSAGERHDTASCIRHMKAELKKSGSWYDRWIMKYIERLY